MQFNKYKFILSAYFCIFLILLSFSAEAAVEYIGNDTETKGNWKGKYGTLGAVLFDARGDQVLEEKIDDYELENVQYWNDPPGPVWKDESAPQSIDAPEDRHAGVIFNTTPFYITVTMLVSDYQIALYFWDWNTQNRVTDVVAYQGKEPPAKEADVTVEGEEHINGVYEIWEISRDNSVTFRLTHVSGVNSMVLGFFVTGPEAVAPADKLTCTWGNIKRAEAALCR